MSLEILAISDRQLLRCIGSYTLRSIRHKRIRETLCKTLIKELFRIKDSGINHYGHTFLPAHLGDEVNQLLILHFC